MSGTRSGLHPLAGNQAKAVLPADSVWLSASAGTGKTQVLSARVLRLLLEPAVRPEQILCLTFTKAGATEMAARINDTLARWVRANDATLGIELAAIGAAVDPPTRARARTLFAGVLDCPGGGLRIDTIHAFSQWLLAAFPEEAGLTAGARPMEEHEARLLSRQVLGDLLLDAEARGYDGLLDAVASLSLRLGAEATERYLMQCAQARELWLGPDGRGTRGWQPPLAGRVKSLLGLASDMDEASVAALCGDDAFDIRSLRMLLSAAQGWTDKKGNLTATAEKKANGIGDWLSADEPARLATLDDLYRNIFTLDDEPSYLAALSKVLPDYAEYCARVKAAITTVREQRDLLALSAWLAPAR